jgi:hypothetical protein
MSAPHLGRFLEAEGLQERAVAGNKKQLNFDGAMSSSRMQPNWVKSEITPHLGWPLEVKRQRRHSDGQGRQSNNNQDTGNQPAGKTDGNMH